MPAAEETNLLLLSSLPDESLIDIARWLPSAKDISNYANACRRLRSVVRENPATLRTILRDRGIVYNVRSLEHLNWYEAIEASGLLQENRIGFTFASTDIDADDQGQIKNSTTRLEVITDLLRRFPTAHISIDAHCGTMSPYDISHGFSRIRGISVIHELFRRGGIVDNNRLVLNAWGRRVADAAVTSDHPYGIVARCGLGWVEIYLEYKCLELPRRPEFYKRVVQE